MKKALSKAREMGINSHKDRKYENKRQEGLEALIPPLEEDFMYPDWFKELQIASYYREPILLVGPTGAGKTLAARQLAAILKVPFARVTMTESTDFRDLWVVLILRDGELIARPTQLLLASQRPSVILLDEVNFRNPKCSAELLQLLDSRKFYQPDLGEVIEVHKEAIFILAMNPADMRYSRRREDVTLLDRCWTIWADPLIQKPEDIERLWGIYTQRSEPEPLPQPPRRGAPSGEEEIMRSFGNFYFEAADLLNKRGTRLELTARALRRFINRWMFDGDVKAALEVGLLNMARALDGDHLVKELQAIAVKHFSPSQLEW